MVAWLAACGPRRGDEAPEDQLWMTGIWSNVLRTEENTGPVSDGGFDSDPGHPARYEIFEDGRYELFRLVSPGEYGTFGSTWEMVGEGEVFAEPTEPLSSTEESLRGYRWEPGTGERGCDTIVHTAVTETGERKPFNLYRGAVCSLQPQPCPQDAYPWDSCWHWIYAWCGEQGTNEPWREEKIGPDRYCHLPGYEEEGD
jgi:hypothetical protein